MNIQCAFIVSPSYSGSTLLSMLLAHHPRLATLGEFLDNKVRGFREGEGDYCSCGARLVDCPYMAELSRQLLAKGIEFSVDYPDTAFQCSTGISARLLRASVRGPIFETVRRWAIPLFPASRRTLRRVVQRNTAVIRTILEMGTADVYLDSAKNNNRVLFFDRYAPQIDVKVIWLIRDGRGVVTSIMRHADCGIELATKKWVTTQKSVINTVRFMPSSKVLTMRYEDLCTKPEESLAKACRFLALDPAGLPEQYGDKELHLTGNNMRLNGLKEIKIDLRWKKSLSASDLRYFNANAGQLNREIGYSHG